MFGLIAKAIRPYREARAQQRQLADTQRQIAALDVQNDALKRRIAYLKTPDGVTHEARKMGYLKPGEIPLVFEGAPVAAQAPAAPSTLPPQPTSPGARARRWWRRLTGH